MAPVGVADGVKEGAVGGRCRRHALLLHPDCGVHGQRTAVSTFVTLLALLPSASSEACSWCGFRNGPQHDGVAPSAGVGTGPPQTSWEASLNASSGSSLAFGADGTLFVGGGTVETAKLPYYGAGLYALDGQTGSTKWFFAVNDTVSGGPAISADGSSVIFGNDDSHLGAGSCGYVYSVSVASGEEQWRFKTRGPYGSVSAPVISPKDGTIFAGANDGNLYALDGASGALLWTFISGSAKQIYSPALSVDSNVVFATCQDGNVYALSSSDGSVLWSHNTLVDELHGLQSSPSVHPSNGVSMSSAC